MTNKTTASANCILKLDNINWTSFDPAMLISMGSIGNIELKGKIVLSSITQPQYNQITNIFGGKVWNLNNSLSINAASGAFIGGPSSVNWKSTGKFSATIFPLSSSQVITWSVLNSSGASVAGISIDSTGLLTTTANLSKDVQMVVKAVSGPTNVSMNVICYGPVYPTSDSYLTAPILINTTGDVSIPLNIVPANANGAYTVDWSVTGTPVTDGYVTIKSQNDSGIILNVNTIYNDNGTHEINITATITRTDGNIYDIKTVAVITTNSFLFTKNDNAEVVAKMFAANKCALSYGMTKAECEAVTALGTMFTKDTALKSFDELQYFTGLTSLGNGCFNGCTSLTNITLPNTINSLGVSCFESCTSLTNITLSNTITQLGDYCFWSCKSLTNITLPNSIKSLGNGCFNGCKSLTNITLPNTITQLTNSCFNDCTSLTNITLPNSIKSLGNYYFQNCSSLTNITLPNSIKSLGDSCFYGCKKLISISCLAASAPTANNSFGNSSSTYIGSSSTNTKYLYVPANATGYEGTTGDGWAVLLDTTKCNFKISKTL